MAKAIAGINKSSRGRGRPPSTGIGAQIGTRWHDHHLAAIDKWRHNQPDRPARPEAIRRLVELGLASAKDQRNHALDEAIEASFPASDPIAMEEPAPSAQRGGKTRRKR